eukprot:3769779-Amphidinium_carterae.1
MLAFTYNPATREWTAAGKPELFPDIKAKTQLYVDRLAGLARPFGIKDAVGTAFPKEVCLTLLEIP